MLQQESIKTTSKLISETLLPSPSYVLLGASVCSSYCLLGEHRGLQAVTGRADPNMTSPWSPGYGRQGHSTTEQMAPRPGSMGAAWVPGGLYQLIKGWAGGGMSSGKGWVPLLAVVLTPAVLLPLAKHPAGLSSGSCPCPHFCS